MKKPIFILSIITIVHTHAMDKPIHVANNMPCYLAMLPTDILDYMAQFLTFDDIESEEEFIERTKITIKKIVPTKYYYKNLQITPNDLFSSLNNDDSFHGTMGILNTFCPNENNIALLDISNLKIISTKKNQILYKESLEHKNYQYIALSRCANMFATISKHMEIVNSTPQHKQSWMSYVSFSHYLTIKNIATQKTEKLKMPTNFQLPYCKTNSLIFGFNKEGTHIIILHDIDRTQISNLSANNMLEDSLPHYIIFPVTVCAINESCAIPSKKTLQHYFEQKGICKNIMGSD